MITEADVKERTIERFWKKVQFDTPDKCWNWTACTISDGYAYFKHDNTVKASRYICKVLFGDFDSNLHVLHKCDNPLCVNPNHLRVGTYRENIDDMVAKGRSLHGSKNALAKLNEENVVEIKRRLAAGEKQAHIGRSFGVTKYLINKIAHNKMWRHVSI